MTRRLLLSYLTITAFVLLILEVPLAITFARGEREALSADVERDARVLATLAEDALEGRAATTTDLQGRVTDYEADTGGRAVIVDALGIGVADSERQDNPQRDFSTRPEIAAALQGNAVSGTRYSQTLGKRFLYVAVPVASGGNIFGAVRVTYPTAELDRRIRRNWLSLAALACVVLLTVAGVGSILARSVTRPVRALERAADSLTRGDLDARAPSDVGPPEVRALSRQFNDMAARLQELVTLQRAFVADASHELRTPLTALRLRLENIESVAPDAMRGDLEAAGEEVARLARLVEGLLALARAEGARPERVAIDVVDEARERVDVWRALAEEQAVTLTLTSGGPACTALAVPGAVAQMLDNLLANALEVAPRDSEIQVRIARTDERVELHVVDRGPGLTAEELARAFDRFWRAPGAAPGRGSGLGLAIVAQFARASGGDARLSAAEGGGIDAAVWLPANGTRE